MRLFGFSNAILIALSFAMGSVAAPVWSSDLFQSNDLLFSVPEVQEARTHLRQGNAPKGLEILESAIQRTASELENKPNDRALALTLTKLHLELNHDDEAAALIQSGMDRDANDIDFLMLHAFLNVRRNQVDEANSSYQKIVKIQPRNAEYLHGYGVFLLSVDRGADALAQFEQALLVDPDYIPAVLMKSVALGRMNRFDEAAKLLEATTKRFPDMTPLHHVLATFYQAHGQDAKACEVLKTCLELDHDFFLARETLSQVTSSLHKSDLFRENYEAIQKLHKDGRISNPSFCRELFRLNGKEVKINEYFELQGPRAVRYVAIVSNERTSEPLFRLSLGSYDFTNEFARTSGDIEEDQRMFHIDFYAKNHHRTYAMIPVVEPTFDEFRSVLMNVLEESAIPVSSSTFQENVVEEDDGADDEDQEDGEQEVVEDLLPAND